MTTFEELQQAIPDDKTQALDGLGEGGSTSNPLSWVGMLFIAAASIGALLETQKDD